MTDSNGNLYRQYVYDPYGNIISVKDGNGNSINIADDTGFNNAYTYRGYRFDPESGLYFLQSRYYAAGIGRFLTKDSLLGDPGSPQTLDRYTYVGGDPVNFIDPSGNRIAGSDGNEYAIVTPSGTIIHEDSGNVTFVPRAAAAGVSTSAAKIVGTQLGTVIITGRGKLGTDTDAIGPHSTFKRDPNTGEITNYRTWESNPRNPSGYDEVFGYDGIGRQEFNKVTREWVETPHSHDPETPGGVRPALPEEMPDMPFLEDIPIFFD
ncbi:tRNA(Glu)-specific nuclease WapA precursor [Peptococcaceae bacterium CEB3]|nr:tRNA(Glu)-specific nuclease WapA precursor [Peptococcaceae bacterium CEB3]